MPKPATSPGSGEGGDNLPRFVISRVEDPHDSPAEPRCSSNEPAAAAAAATFETKSPTVESCAAATESDQLMAINKGGKHMALYDEDADERPFVSRVINRLANYDGGMIQNAEQVEAGEPDTPDVATPTASKKKKKAGKKAPATKKLGTVLGVYFPCIQNIFGVILFIRLVWVVGTAGWFEAFIIAFMCCCCTMTTSISMSAIATNGVVPGGGSYFMISRALGPEFGGAVGILFYLGTTVASSMYIVGAVEIFLQYMAPDSFALFGPLNIPNNAYNSYRIYGTVLLIIMFTCVFIGVKFVSWFSPFALFCVIGSIICVYIGIFTANPDRGPRICLLGDRLLALDKIRNETTGEMECHTRPDGPLYQLYCGNFTSEDGTVDQSDPDCDFLMKNGVTEKAGIPGVNFETFKNNFGSRYTQLGYRIGSQEKGNIDKGDIVSDITASFVVLIGIFFPSVTGIMAGSNRSGDLADAQKSIPVGTIGAVTTTSIVYLSCLLLFGATVEGQFLRDKFGESMGGGLIVAQMAWPNPWVIMIGSFLSTCGAGLQSLVGAPRLLQAIAADGVIPFINPFRETNQKGEPRRALYLTAAIAEAGVLLANVDYIAPIITMFFLMCYCFTNLACAVQTLLRTPNWRPRFRFYHWVLSLFGVCLCLSLMFMASWYFAIVALLIAASIYKYIEYKGAEKEWGDGIRGLAMSAARYALLRLEEGEPHVKNWRPQLLVLMKMDNNLEPKYRKLLTFASQLKAGKGLTLVSGVLEGEYSQRKDDVEIARHNIMEVMKRERAKGFSDVIVSRNVGDGINYLIQGAGLGGLRHNAVLFGWPQKWREEAGGYKAFIDTMRLISDRQLAAMIVKGIGQFPENGDRLGGTIDIWWIVHEGGLLMLIPFLLTQGKVWKKCKLRIFTVAQIEDNNIQLKKDLEKFVYYLRINAEVHVIEMPNSDISEYTYERTLMMEQRNELLAKMHLKKQSLTPQTIVDLAHHPHHTHHLELLHKAALAADKNPLPTIGSNCQYPASATAASGSSSVNIPIDHPTADQPTSSVPPSYAAALDMPNDQGSNHVASPSRTATEQPGTAGDGGSSESAATGADSDTRQEEQSSPADTEAPQQAAGPGVSAAVGDKSAAKGTDTSTTASVATVPDQPTSQNGRPEGLKSDSRNVQRMTTAIRLNQVIKQNSLEAKLTIINLPGPPKDPAGEKGYMDFLEALTENLERVLLVRGGGREVITIYS